MLIVLSEMKHMYTNGSPDHVYKLPEPFKTVILGSTLWKWERSQGMTTTSCLSTLWPKDDKQDVSFTIWGGNHDTYLINDMLGLQLAISS